MVTPAIDIHLTQQQLFALGNQLGTTLGPLSPLKPKNAEQQAMAKERVLSPSLMGADGKMRPELLPAFKTLTNPQAYALLAYMGRSFLLETSYYYPDATTANGNVSLTDTDKGLKLSSPGVKEDVFTLLGQYIGETLLRRADYDFNLPLMDAWILFGVVDSCRRKMLNAVLDYGLLPNIEISLDEIYSAINVETNNMQWFSPYFEGCLSLAQISHSDTQIGIQNLVDKGLLRLQGNTIIPADSVVRIADEFLVIDGHLRLRTGIMSADQPQHVDMRAIQGRSGAIMFWSYDTQAIDLISLSPAQLMLIISSIIENPAAHLAEEGVLQRPHVSPTTPPESLS